MESRAETRQFSLTKGMAVVMGSFALASVHKQAGQQPLSPEPTLPPDKYHEITYAAPKQADQCAHISHTGSQKDQVIVSAFDFFHDKLKPFQIAGIVGNFEQESDLDPSDSGGYLGQWGGGRLAALERFAARRGKPVTNPRIQYAYTWMELTGSPGAGEDDRKVLRELRSTTTSTEAAVVFSDGFERPGEPLMENRIRYASNILHKYGSVACTGEPVARIAIPKQS